MTEQPSVPWQAGLDFGRGYDNVRGEPKQLSVLGSAAMESA